MHCDLSSSVCYALLSPPLSLYFSFSSVSPCCCSSVCLSVCQSVSICAFLCVSDGVFQSVCYMMSSIPSITTNRCVYCWFRSRQNCVGVSSDVSQFQIKLSTTRLMVTQCYWFQLRQNTQKRRKKQNLNLNVYQGSHYISVGTNCLVVPSIKLSTVDSRAFPVIDPQIWNDLPPDWLSRWLHFAGGSKRIQGRFYVGAGGVCLQIQNLADRSDVTWFLRSQNAPKSKFSGTPMGSLQRSPDPLPRTGDGERTRCPSQELHPRSGLFGSRFYGSQGLTHYKVISNVNFVFFGFEERRKWTRWWRGWWGNGP